MIDVYIANCGGSVEPDPINVENCHCDIDVVYLQKFQLFNYLQGEESIPDFAINVTQCLRKTQKGRGQTPLE